MLRGYSAEAAGVWIGGIAALTLAGRYRSVVGSCWGRSDCPRGLTFRQPTCHWDWFRPLVAGDRTFDPPGFRRFAFLRLGGWLGFRRAVRLVYQTRVGRNRHCRTGFLACRCPRTFAQLPFAQFHRRSFVRGFVAPKPRVACFARPGCRLPGQPPWDWTPETAVVGLRLVACSQRGLDSARIVRRGIRRAGTGSFPLERPRWRKARQFFVDRCRPDWWPVDSRFSRPRARRVGWRLGDFPAGCPPLGLSWLDPFRRLAGWIRRFPFPEVR